MKLSVYDLYAQEYDAWFLQNEALLQSEAALVAAALGQAGETLSVGCGSGLFEMILQKQYGITIHYGVEPSAPMAEIARLRGMEVTLGGAESTPMGQAKYDTVLFNGCPSYIQDLEGAFANAYKALKPGGRVVVVDVPKESAYALLYNLALSLNTWDHPLLEGVKPLHPYPIDFVKSAAWRTTEEKVCLLKATGFAHFRFLQTLTRLPHYSHLAVEEPIEGYDKGSYVAIIARKNH